MELIDRILSDGNIEAAIHAVKSNRGAAGISTSSGCVSFGFGTSAISAFLQQQTQQQLLIGLGVHLLRLLQPQFLMRSVQRGQRLCARVAAGGDLLAQIAISSEILPTLPVRTHAICIRILFLCVNCYG